MSTDDKNTACPNVSENIDSEFDRANSDVQCIDEFCEKKKKKPYRTVSFPDEEGLVTQYFEPANPWQDVPTTTRAQLAAEYLELCRRHYTPPIDSVLQQIRELPENAIGGEVRAPRLTLAECSLLGSAPADALEAVLRKVQFRRLEIEHAAVDDEGAEAIFDMIEYYESATVVAISGPRQFGIRGWQAASRMIKKSAELCELEVMESALEASHAPVLARALRPHTCRLRALALQRAELAGDPLLCLVIALKSNSSIRELRLGDNRLSVSDAAQLGSLLRFNTRIRMLDLSNNQIQDAGVGHIADALAEQGAQTPPSAAASPVAPHHCPLMGDHEARGLAVLVLWNNQLTRNSAQHLSKALRSSQSLCVLNIGRNAVGSETIRALCSAGSLISLGLQAARLPADSAKPLADLIRSDCTLQRLDLRDNRLGSAGLQAILNALKENTTLTQIDLDDPAESSLTLCAENGEAAIVARLTREIRALCRRNEPTAASPNTVHRKISLTCPSVCLNRGMSTGEAERRSRLRSPLPSPAPSPASSPIPTATHSRFLVTKVTPDRESSSESSTPSTPSTPTRPHCPTSSRFKVVQVMETPKIQVQGTSSQVKSSQSRKSPSRFSVTRNYDKIYTPTLTPSPPPNAAITESRTASTELRPASTEPRPACTESRTASTEPRPASTEPRLASTELRPASTEPRPSNTVLKSASIEPKPAGTGNKPASTELRPVSKEIRPANTELRPTSAEPRPAITELRSVSTETNLVNIDLRPADKESGSADSDFKSASTMLRRSDTENRPNIGTSSTNTETECSLETKLPITDLVHTSTVPKSSNTELRPYDTESCRDEHSRRNEFRLPTTKSMGTENDEIIEFDFPDSNLIKPIRELCGPMDLEPSVEDPDKALRSDDDGYRTTDVELISELRPLVKEGNNDIRPKPSVSPTVRPGDTAHSEISDKMELCIAKKDKSDDNLVKVSEKTYSDAVKSETNSKYKDKSEQLCHNEEVGMKGDERVVKTETKLIKNSVEMSETDKLDVQVEVTVIKESTQPAKVNVDQNNREFVNIGDVTVTQKRDSTLKQIQVITEDLGHIIDEMKYVTIKTSKKKSDDSKESVNSNVDIVVPVKVRDSVVLKKNKSESSLDSPDLEVSRLMNKKLVGSPFCDSSSSLEISGSSMESLNDQQNLQIKPIIIQESVESDLELDRRKPDHVMLSTESSIESNTSDATPVNSGNLLNLSVSSNESVSPIIFGRVKKIHDSLSSLEASVSSLDSGRQEKIMVTSADSGIEYSLQQPSENKEDNSSNEGTLTNFSSLKESGRKPESLLLQETLRSSPKRTSSLLDVPALKSKGLDRMRKISWVAPSPSFHIPKPEPEKIETKLPLHLEKLLSLFQHPSSLFSRSTQDDEKKSNTPPRKDSSLTSSFWSWGSSTEKTEKDEKDDSSEATDSTLSERVQVSFVDESFSKKLDSKTPSTDTDNTLSEFQSFPIQSAETSISQEFDRKPVTTEENIVQKLVLSADASSNGNFGTSDNIDLKKPNDLNKNYAGDDNKNSGAENDEKTEVKADKAEDRPEVVRPRSFAAVLKSSGSENSLDKQPSPDNGQPVDKLPSKVIRGIKENISPENTLTSSMSNTKALAFELSERQVKNQAIVNTVWEVTTPLFDKSDKVEEVKSQSDLAPIATIEETCDEAADNNIQLQFIDDVKIDDRNIAADSDVTLEGASAKIIETMTKVLENVDLGKDALSYLIYESQDFEPDTESTVHPKTSVKVGSLAQELKEAEIKEMLDLSPELVIDEAVEVPEVFTAKEIKGLKTSPVIPERAKLKKSNSLEDLSLSESEKTSPKTKTIAFKVPETSPRDIPERRTKLRSRSGSSPKSLPESLNKPCPLSKMDSILSKKKKKVSSLGKMARDSLLALNMSEEEIAEFRKSYKLTSVESLKSLESVSEDANSQSGNSVDSRCRACLRTSQESLMSLDSITEDCRCGDDCDKSRHNVR